MHCDSKLPSTSRPVSLVISWRLDGSKMEVGSWQGRNDDVINVGIPGPAILCSGTVSQ